MRKKKLKTGIFHKLVLSYVIFAVLTFLVILLCFLLAATKMGNGNADNLSVYDIVDDEGNIVNEQPIKELGAWIEVLDEEYNVTEVYGTKRTEQMQYTPGDIFSITSSEEDTARDYVGFIKYVEKTKKYYLIMYNKSSVQYNVTFLINMTGENSTSPVTIMMYALFFGLSIANVLLLSLYLRHKIKKPLDALMAGMEKVKAGESNVTLNMKTEAEFEQIMEAFNVMSNQLEKEKAENAMLIKKKNQLLLELSHDIKTPIATIKSYSNALEAGLVPEEKKQSYYQTIDKKVDRILNLSEDMFLMLKMDYEDYKIQTEKTDICELLRKICAEYYDEIEGAGFEFSVRIPEEAYYYPIDVRLFARVIGNLLTNAQKYNRTGRQIQVLFDENNATIKIMDDGKEIKQEENHSIFDAFSRGDKARSSDGGTGLGLAIAKTIVEKHAGEIGYCREEDWNLFYIKLSVEKNKKNSM